MEQNLRIHAGLLGTLLLLAFLLRGILPDLFEFKEDQFMGIKLAYDNLHGSGYAITGLRSSTGLFNPPFFIYLLSLPVLFSTDPIAVTYFIVGLNLLGLVVFYFFSKKLFAPSMALIITTLFASSPWSIMYSRHIWAQNCLFLFMILFYMVLLSHIGKYQSRKIYLLSILLALITQLHMSAWFLPFPLLVFCILFKIRVRMRDGFIGLLLFVVIYLPYFYSLILENPLSSIQESQASALLETLPPLSHLLNAYLAAAWENVTWPFVITGGGGFQYFLGETGWQAFAEAYPVRLLHPFFLLHYLFAVAGLLYAINVSYKRFKSYRQGGELSAEERVLLLFLFVYLGIQGLYFLLKIGPYPHYSIVLYPVLAVFTVLFFDACCRRGNYWIKKGLSGLLVLIICSNLVFISFFFVFIRNHPEEIAGDYGLPYFLTKDTWQEKLP